MNYENKLEQIDELNKQIAVFRPINKDLLKQIKEYYRIGLTYSSNAIEGNTLTETETKVVLEDGLTIAGKPLRDHYEASGHSEAFDCVYELAKKRTITEKDILNIHRLFYYRIDEDNAGKYRKVPVVITGTDFRPPAPGKVPGLMRKIMAGIPAMRKKLHPVVFAAKLHEGLVDIHPFVDGNGRTARLLMNFALFQAGYTITVIPPILRGDYIALVKRSQTGPEDDTDFVNFISCMVYESTKDYLRLLKDTSG
ncbi:MAG: cell filamentation protein Fic [Bdellovibrionales bacterium RIFOXYD1_FULL_53_11]|nr:MAG: cell filamentation protein Fic [Bdellovibrionales bacterium RIFOXYD1_FULL_53_11]